MYRWNDAWIEHEFRWRDSRVSNPRLHEQKVGMNLTILPVFEAEGTDVWEDDGGYVHPAEEVSHEELISRGLMRLRGSRKQRAARAYIPKESITKVPVKVARNAEAVIKELEDAQRSEEMKQYAVQKAVRKASEPTIKKVEVSSRVTALEAAIEKLNKIFKNL